MPHGFTLVSAALAAALLAGCATASTSSSAVVPLPPKVELVEQHEPTAKPSDAVQVSPVAMPTSTDPPRAEPTPARHDDTVKAEWDPFRSDVVDDNATGEEVVRNVLSTPKASAPPKPVANDKK